MAWKATVRPLPEALDNLVNGVFTIEVDYINDVGKEVGRSYQVNVASFSDSNYLANLVQNELNNFEAYDKILTTVNKISEQAIEVADSATAINIAEAVKTPLSKVPLVKESIATDPVI